MKIAVLFDGAGLARLGLERAGHLCFGIELDPVAHHLGQSVGNGGCFLDDARGVEARDLILRSDAVWASPPCQKRSSARTQGPPSGGFADDLLEWSLSLRERYPHLKALWVENIVSQSAADNTWGTKWNAAQFAEFPKQNRQRMVGGFYPEPEVYRDFKPYYKGMDLCPCVTATEYKGCASDKRRASRYYGAKLSLEDVSFRMGMERLPNTRDEYISYTYVPEEWADQPEWFEGTKTVWRNAQYRALGNGVPVWMAKAFGTAAKEKFG